MGTSPYPADPFQTKLIKKQKVAAHATSLKANPTRGFIVGGSSAGGNLSAIMAHLARDEKLSPPLTGQYLSVPALLPYKVVPEEYKSEYLSYSENTSDPVLKEINMDGLVSQYPRLHLPFHHYHPCNPHPQIDILKCTFDTPLFVPFNHPLGHKDLPPAYFQICGMDPLRDEGLIYERVLREECGVKTRLDVYAGFGHMFWTNWPEMETSRRFVGDTLEGVRWLLGCVEGGG